MSQNLHKAAALLHGSQAIALTVLLSTNDSLRPWPLITTGFGKVQDVWTQDVFYLLPAFSALSTVNHSVMAWSTTYYEQVQRTHVHPLQWLEYSVSAGLMTWMLAVTCGVVDVNTLTQLVWLNVLMQYTGYAIEKAKAQKQDWRPWLWMGWGLFVAIWSILMVSFYVVLSHTTTDIPDILYLIIFFMVALFASFGINQGLYAADYIDWHKYQVGSITLSFVTKTLLVWLVYGGLIRDHEDISTQLSSST